MHRILKIINTVADFLADPLLLRKLYRLRRICAQQENARRFASRYRLWSLLYPDAKYCTQEWADGVELALLTTRDAHKALAKELDWVWWHAPAYHAEATYVLRSLKFV